jgi:hypothetical protein
LDAPTRKGRSAARRHSRGALHQHPATFTWAVQRSCPTARTAFQSPSLAPRPPARPRLPMKMCSSSVVPHATARFARRHSVPMPPLGPSYRAASAPAGPARGSSTQKFVKKVVPRARTRRAVSPTPPDQRQFEFTNFSYHYNYDNYKITKLNPDTPKSPLIIIIRGR